MMLCKNASKEILSSKDYLFQIKYDGTRAVYTDKKLINRRNEDISFRFQEIIEELKQLNLLYAIDGEIICKDFNSLQIREHQVNDYKISLLKNIYPASFVIFDIIRQNAKIEQRLLFLNELKILKKLLYVRTAETYEDGLFLWKTVEKEQLEGIIAKKKGSYYEDRRSDSWLKIKNWKFMEVIVLDYLKRKEGYILSTQYGNINYTKDISRLKDIKGKKIKVKYLELTKDNKMRFPILLL